MQIVGVSKRADIPFTDHLVSRLDDPANGGNGNNELDDDEAARIFQFSDEIQYKSDQEWAFMGSYARDIGRWAIGGNVKVIRQSVGDYTSFGLGVDLGLMRRNWWKQLDFGIKFADPGPGPKTTSVLEVDETPIDPRRRVHAAKWLGNIYARKKD